MKAQLSTALQVAIVEDSELIRGQLVRLLTLRPGIQVVGQASEEDAAVTLIATLQPHAVVLDMGLAQGSGLGVLRRLRAQHCASQILVLTFQPEVQLRRACEALGIAGFYDKGMQLEDCIQKIYGMAGEQGSQKRR